MSKSTVGSQIKILEEVIANLEKDGKDPQELREFLECWKRWQKKHGDSLEVPPKPTKSKSDGVKG